MSGLDKCRAKLLELMAIGCSSFTLGHSPTLWLRMPDSARSAPSARIDYVRKQNAKLAKKLDRAEVDGIRYLNEMRIVMGFKPMLIDPKLCAAARGHSKDMQTLDFFDHESPVEGKATFLDRARLAGTKANGENIYWGSPNGRNAIDVWFSSPPHHWNMFDPDWTHQGIGRWEDHWTQMFRQ